MDFRSAMGTIVEIFDVVGVAIFAIGSAAAAIRAAVSWSRGQRTGMYGQIRRDVGRSILLGLEVLIIADIVNTIVVDLTLESALILSIIVVVRTFLSFSLEVELEGAFPWRLASVRRVAVPGSDPRG